MTDSEQGSRAVDGEAKHDHWLGILAKLAYLEHMQRQFRRQRVEPPVKL